MKTHTVTLKHKKELTGQWAMNGGTGAAGVIVKHGLWVMADDNFSLQGGEIMS